jgi:hypothetical protein
VVLNRFGFLFGKPNKISSATIALPVDHVNDRRESIAAIRFDEIRRKRRVSFEMRAQSLAALDLIEKVVKRLRAQPVQPPGEILQPAPAGGGRSA